MTMASKRHRKVFATRASTRRRTDRIAVARRHREQLMRAAEQEIIMASQPSVTVKCSNCQAKNAWLPGTALRCSECHAVLRTAQMVSHGPRIQTR